MRPVLLLTVCSLFFFASVVNAEFYRWVDKDGKENYTNDQNKIPSEYRQQSSSVEVDSTRVSIGDKPEGAVSKKGFEHKDKNGRGEEWWHRRAENLRLEIRDLEDEQALVLKKEQERKATGSKKSKSKTNYEQKKMQLEKKIAQARRRLDVDLPEEARKADAYPGWLRE